VLRYHRPTIKRLDTGAIVSMPAPLGVLEGSRADVSVCAGLLVDKFVYHLPLYRQHQRMLDSGLRVSRLWLTQLAQQISALLEPIYTAQLACILDRGRANASKSISGPFMASTTKCVLRFRPRARIPWWPTRWA